MDDDVHAAPASNWRDALHAHSPGLHDALSGYMSSVMDDGPLSRKQVELTLLTVVTALRYRPSIERHTTGAIDAGASREEVIQCIALAGMVGGVPCIREGLAVADRVLKIE